MFTKKQLRALLLPLILEQLLSGLMGLADTLMVSNVSEAALSAVSLTDSINTLILNLLAALATGGIIVCSQYLGRGDARGANEAARQVMLVAFVLSVALTLVCVIPRRAILGLIFGSIEPEVMDFACDYFLITALSYPAMALQQTAAAIFRADGRAKPPMLVAAGANCVNVVGNAILIFGFHMGVVGAALATLVSRVINAVVLLALLRGPQLTLRLDHYLSIRPDWATIRQVLRIGIPSGVENSMFQVGKLAVQSTVATLGTSAIAAQAMMTTLEYFQSLPPQAVGLGLLTVAGQCMGAGRVDETRRYTRTFCIWGEIALGISVGAVLLAFPFITGLSSMTAESIALTWKLLVSVSAVKLVLWVVAFVLPNTLRAAGDTAFAAVVSSITMWVFRVSLSTVLVRFFAFGLEAVWFGWCVDWLIRCVLYLLRYRGERWTRKKVLN